MQAPVLNTVSDQIDTHGEPCRAGVKVVAHDKKAAWDDLDGVRSELVSWDEIEKDENALTRVANRLATALESR